MDTIVGFAFLFLALLFAPWIVVWIRSRQLRREREQDLQHWQELRDRLRGLELAVASLVKTEGQSKPAAPVEAHSLVRTPAPAPAQPAAAAPPSAPPPLVKPAVPPEQTAVVAPPVRPPEFSFGGMAGSARATGEAAQPTLMDRLKGGLDLEEALGTNWLNKLGIVILVLGIVFFLIYQLRQVGPAGKVVVGYLVSAVLLGGGLWLERRERYRIFARGAIGGGWALTFLVTFGLYHIPAAQVLDSQLVDLWLMLLVAAGMVLHSLHFRSQVVTGLAVLLAFASVTISEQTVYSLTAGAILSLALVVVVGRMQWFELEIFGLLAAYLNHWWWLRRIIEPMHGHKHPFPEFLPSAGLLVFYWLIFRVSYLWRNCEEKRQERLSTVAALLNSVLLLAVMKYQAVHPEWAFWALLAIGAAEMTMGQLPLARRRRTPFVVLTTIGAALLVSAIPFRYSGARLTILWLMEAEALFLVGIFTRESIFRRLGGLASLLVPLQLLAYDAAAIYGRRMDDADLSRQPVSALLLAISALVLYGNSHFAFRRWPELFEHTVDRTVLARLSYVAGVALLVAAWIEFPGTETVVAWSVVALALGFFGRRYLLPQLAWQSHAIFALAVLRALAVNLQTTAQWGSISQRLASFAVIATALYLASGWSGGGERWRWLRRLPATYQWVGSSLVMLVAWYELRPAAVTVAWAIFGLALIETGVALRSSSWRWQGYAALAMSFVRMFFVNLNAAGTPGQISPRVYTVLPLVAVFFYIYLRLQSFAQAEPGMDHKAHAGDLAAWAGTVSVAALMRFELNLDWVVAAWSGLVLVLLMIAWRASRQVFLQQAVAGAFAVLFRGVFHNIAERAWLPAATIWHSRVLCLSVASAGLLLGLWFAFRLRCPAADESTDDSRIRGAWSAVMRHPEQTFFFVPLVIIMLLLAVELHGGMITVGWSILSVAVFLFALAVGERSFRWAGLVLLLVSVGKIVVSDAWAMNARDRYITFIVLGTAVLSVNFLYSHYREAIRKYL